MFEQNKYKDPSQEIQYILDLLSYVEEAHSSVKEELEGMERIIEHLKEEIWRLTYGDQ